MSKIKITCKTADHLDYNKIEEFQGGLKTIDQDSLDRLKQEILDYGFNSPLHIWKTGKKFKNLDGHQRILAVKQLEEQGWDIPPLPVVFITAKNEKQAKHILLSRVSQYGKVDQSGLYSFMADSSIDLDELKDSFVLPEVNFEKFENRFFTNPEKGEGEGPDNDDGESNSNLVHTCPKCNHKFGKGA